MSTGKAQNPELNNFMDKTLILRINGNRRIKGTLRGFDLFMNLSLEDAFELRTVPKDGNNEAKELQVPMGMTVVRGNSILMIDCQE